MGFGKDILQIEFKGEAQFSQDFEPVKSRFWSWLNFGKFQKFHFQTDIVIFE